MPLHCPFCHAVEDGRIEAQDESGNNVILVMFGCPFFYRFPMNELSDSASESIAQRNLDNWKKSKGAKWLESLGPVLREREQKNMLKYEQILARQAGSLTVDKR
jgi:hypothetical protein